MKTIYNLEVGDSYYTPLLSMFTDRLENPFFLWVPRKVKIENLYYFIQFDGVRKGGRAFLTEEECQKSIDYDVALAKIKNRASELDYRYSDVDSKEFYVIWNDDENGDLHCSPHSKTNSFKLAFKCFETGVIIIEELPEEVECVLKNGKI